eukprot:COSAG02_NODE_2193_length_9555_cov_102.183481_3_plen_74_part_00
MMTDFDPASIIWCSQKLYDYWVNGDGYYMYPGPDGPISTSRLEEIRDALVLHLTMFQQTICAFVYGLPHISST